jgi:hypothetical protein
MKRLTRVERAARAIYKSDMAHLAKVYETPALLKHSWIHNADQDMKDRCMRRAKAALSA